MNKPTAYIESGILELYALGLTSPEETAELERMASEYPEIRSQLDEIEASLESYALAHAEEPHALVKPLLLASIEYAERLKKGEAVTHPPLLHPQSSPAEFSPWLERPDMILPDDADNLFAQLIGHDEKATTAIVWIKESTPYEVHTGEHERFLVIEGSCDFQVGDQVFKLKAGDFLEIPLHVGHTAKVTSAFPCKVILQHVALAA